MAQNIEYNIYARIMTQLENISGTGDYNYRVVPDDIYGEFKMPEEVPKGQDHPVLCVGEFRTSSSLMRRRNDFEIPVSYEIWGYIRDSKDPMGAALKLESDIRIAIAGDEDLNHLVTEMDFETSLGAHEGLGIVLFVVRATANYDTA